MPIYEYQCRKCRKTSNFLVRNPKKHKPPACPKCGHSKMERLLSRFAAPSRGAPGRANQPDRPDLPEDDPRAMGRMMRKLAEESGEEIPSEMDDVVQRLESGEDPEKIEEDMGDELGEGGAGGGDDDKLYES